MYTKMWGINTFNILTNMSGIRKTVSSYSANKSDNFTCGLLAYGLTNQNTEQWISITIQFDVKSSEYLLASILSSAFFLNH